MSERRIALVTGANACVSPLITPSTELRSLGLESSLPALLDRHMWELAQRVSGVALALACRSRSRAETARKELLEIVYKDEMERKMADVDPDLLQVLVVDFSLCASVLAAVEETKEKFSKLDFLFLNAGIYPIDGINLRNAIYDIFFQPTYLFTCGGDVLPQPIGTKTAEGLGLVFMANVFGQYLFARECKGLLEKGESEWEKGLGGDKKINGHSNGMANGHANGTAHGRANGTTYGHASEGNGHSTATLSHTTGGRIIWTGSSSAFPEFFSLSDPLLLSTKKAYEGSKRLDDLVSLAWNRNEERRAARAKEDGQVVKVVKSFVANPGTPISGLVFTQIHWILTQFIIYPLFWVFNRLALFSVHASPYTSAVALNYLFLTPSSQLDTRLKYHSLASFLGLGSGRTSNLGEMVDRTVDGRSEADVVMEIVEEMAVKVLSRWKERDASGLGDLSDIWEDPKSK
ncbi:hypothetical protein HDU93_000172 [Gonapodya sp. JEL0774]|nr:hypothetical protein HDU93_000172 [Gonapodya sp. JEL0774]